MNSSLTNKWTRTVLLLFLSVVLMFCTVWNVVSAGGAFAATQSSLVSVERIKEAAQFALLSAEGAKDVRVTPVTTENLCEYPLTETTIHPAYAVRCTTEKGTYRVFVDALNGSVLDYCSAVFGESAECYDVEGKSFSALYSQKLSKYVLGNEDQNTYIVTLNGKNYYQGAKGSYVVSEDRIFGNTKEEVDLDYHKATKYYDTLSRIRKYYKTAYGAEGDKYLIGMYNDSYDGGNNSFATDDIIWKGDVIPVGSIVGVISLGMNQDATCLDLLAHEYMHRVEQNKVGLIYRGESGALMEAYSDIFGELVEAGIQKKTPDWVHNSIRDLKHPAVHGYPEVYQGEYYVTDSSADNGSVHKNSTVISHAAYLMWNGIDGTSSRKLDSETLAKLFMNSLDKFNVRETFPQCAEAVYATAKEMNLTKAQLGCVVTAFSMAGLPVDSSGTSSEENTITIAGLTLPDLTFGNIPGTSSVG